MKETNKKDDNPKMNSTNEIHRTGIPINWLDLVGRFRVTTTIPDYVPKTVSQQCLIYVDDLDTPTVQRLYIYISEGVNTWKYLDLGTTATTSIEGEVTGMKLYHGEVTSNGTAGTPFPTGWTASRTSEGVYLVTHNLSGSSDYTVQATMDDTTEANRVVIERDSNSFDIEVTDENGDPDDGGVNFIVIYQP